MAQARAYGRGPSFGNDSEGSVEGMEVISDETEANVGVGGCVEQQRWQRRQRPHRYELDDQQAVCSARDNEGSGDAGAAAMSQATPISMVARQGVGRVSSFRVVARTARARERERCGQC